MPVEVRLCRSEVKLQESVVPFFHHVGPGVELRSSDLVAKCMFYPVNTCSYLSLPIFKKDLSLFGGGGVFA